MIWIGACPRSGTKFAARYLTECGLPMGHEIPKDMGVVSWKHRINKSFQPDLVLHQVRHPQMVISSMHAMSLASKDRLTRQYSNSDPQFWYWAHNNYIKEHSHYTYRIEDWDDELETIIRLVVGGNLKHHFDKPIVAQDLNTYRGMARKEALYVDVEWRELWPQVQIQAERYGYEALAPR